MDFQLHWKLISLLYIFTVLNRASGQYIDQIIQEAMNETDPNAIHSPVPGVVQVELDMLFKQDEYNAMVQADEAAEEESSDDDAKRRKKRKAIRGSHKRWTNKIIYYYYTPNTFSSRDQSVINSAMQHWERYTCLDFQSATSSTRNYIQFVNGGGCSSYVGMSGGMQPVTLAPGCRQHGTVVHELGHAIGFHHEQTRPDRDGYVTIYSQNVIPSTLFNFQKHSTSVLNAHGVTYDYRSVMHYGQYAFTSNRGRTIITKDSAYQNIIGTAVGLSFRDIKLANIIYNCNSHCGSKSCPGEGFVGKDCKCWCPGTSDPKNTPVVECGGGEVVTSGPVTSSPVTPAPTPRPGNCVDNHRHCASWASSGYCQSNPGYMLVNCKRSCNSCNGGVVVNCNDKSTNCGYWSRVGYCRSYYYAAYMKQNCKRSCQMCSSAPEAETEMVDIPECKNYHRHCESWSDSGYCDSNPDYMLSYCPKSCGSCTVAATVNNTDNTDCTNNHRYCESWQQSGYCDTNPDYMLVECRKACGICTGGADSDEAETAQDCTDDHQHCASWSQQGYCLTNAAYMLVNCRLSCGVCTAGADAEVVTTVQECTDDHQHCASWSQQGYCQSNAAYMLVNCKNSCGVC